MKQFKSILRLGFICLLSFFAIFVSVAGAQDVQNQSEPEVLARVVVKGPLEDFGLPIYAHLQNSKGRHFALVIASVTQLDEARVSYEILDTIPEEDDRKYYMIAMMKSNSAHKAAAAIVNVLHDDGFHIIARVSEGEALQLNVIGFEIVQLRGTPMVFRAAAQSFLAQESVASIDAVAEMIKSVKRSTVVEHMENLTGVHPVDIGESEFTIKTRHTNSYIDLIDLITSGKIEQPYPGTIKTATQYVYDFMKNELGENNVSYQDWTLFDFNAENPDPPPFTENVNGQHNVIGEIKGSDEIVLIVAHLDSQPGGDNLLAPGADDNASGSVGVMMAAQALSQSGCDFERTIRFVLFTGEEQGLLGSKAYADSVKDEDVVAVYNMDMISWDAMNEPKLRIYTRAKRDPGHEGDMVIANTFLDVVNTYEALDGIPLSTVLAPEITLKGGHWGGHWSDQASFWGEGFSAVCAIEDDHSDWNRTNYHTVDDTIHTLNFTYFINFIRATVGTAAHLAIPAGECQQ